MRGGHAGGFALALRRVCDAGHENPLAGFQLLWCGDLALGLFGEPAGQEVEPRGHELMADKVLPDALGSTDPAVAQALQARLFDRLLQRLAGVDEVGDEQIAARPTSRCATRE